ncbi:serine hydrolase domain-containing protein [Bacillus salitolerans]|uniref:Serine hydrolase domain-containing protein n=1 Tax=Bacillus salitolerans TaxID=1437434 RepID=A0ABW4LIZ6_9BACI
MNESFEQLNDYITQFMTEYDVPGLAIAISKNGNLLLEKGYGFQNLSKQEPVTPNTIFGIASISKSFTSLGITLLEKQGKLSIHDPISKYIPELFIPNVENMKIHHLLTHSTGLPSLFRQEQLNRFSDHVDYFNSFEHEPFGKPGEYFSYNNDTFLLLGAIIERVTGKLYRRFMTEEVLNPLGLYRSTYSIEELDKYTDVTTPYVKGSNKSHEVSYFPPLGNYEVGGGVRSCVADLIRYGECFIRNGQPLFNDNQLSAMYQPHMTIRQNEYYGYGLKVTPTYHGYTLVEHGGDQPGVSSIFGFVPKLGYVVSVLINVSGVPVNKVWLAAINTLLKLPLHTKKIEYPIYNATKEELSAFVGHYKGNENEVEIVLEEKLLLKAGEQTIPLRLSSLNTLVTEKEEMPLTFYYKDQKIWALLLGVRILRRTPS